VAGNFEISKKAGKIRDDKKGGKMDLRERSDKRSKVPIHPATA